MPSEESRTVIETYSREPRLKYSLCNSGKGHQSTDVIDTKTPLQKQSYISVWALKQLLISAFLPQGFPHTVTDDYLEYQMWDTLQALASSLTGALATEAVLTSAGVGNKDATALAATITWLLKDGCGMVGRIIFSYVKGSELDAESKKWRLVADILNDAAFFIDLLSPAFPTLFLPLACCSSLLRCIVGVAGGATRTAIIQYQARRNNLADVAAKDGSQETMVNVMALLLSLIVLPLVSGNKPVVWALFTVLTTLHLFANYRAVRSLRFNILNRNRAAILIRHYLSTGSALSVLEVNVREPLFRPLMGRLVLGCSRRDIHIEAQSKRVSPLVRENYVLLPTNTKGMVAMKKGASSLDQLCAVFELEMSREDGGKSARTTNHGWRGFIAEAEEKGFILNANHLCFDEWEWEEKRD